MPDIKATAYDGSVHSFPDGTPDDVVDRVMKQYAGTKTQAQVVPTAPTQAPSIGVSAEQMRQQAQAENVRQGSGLLDRVSSTYLPEMLAPVGRVLTQPIGQTLGIQNKPLAESVAAARPTIEKAVGPYWADAAKIGSSLVDFVSSPQGIATVGLEALTAGAATPYLAAGYGGVMAPGAVEATQRAIKEPTPENIQDALTQQAFTVAASSGMRGQDVGFQAVPTPKLRPKMWTPEESAPISTGPQALPTPHPAGLATGGTIGMDRLDPKDLVAPAAKATTIDRQKMADARANAPVDIVPEALPEAGYRPSEKAETMSAPTKDLGSDFKVNEWKHEIDRNNGVINNPAATIEERSIASDRLRDAKEGIAAITAPPTPGMIQSLLTGQMEPAMTELRLLREEVAKRTAEEAAKPVDLAPKEAEPISAPPPRGSAVDYNLPKPLVDNIEMSLRLKKLASREDNTEEQTNAINARIVAVNAEARMQTRSHFNSLSDRQLDQLQVELNSNADLQSKQADYIRKEVKNAPLVETANQALKDAQATGGPVRAGIDPETGAPKAIKPESIIDLESRQLISELRGRKSGVEPEMLIPHPKPEGMDEVEYQTYIAKLQAHRMEMRKQIADAYEIVKDTGQGSDDLMEMLHDLDETVGLIGTYPKNISVSGRAKIIDSDAPGAGMTLEKARKIMGSKVNRIPAPEEFEAKASDLTERSRINKMLSDVIDKEKDRRVGKYVPPTPKGPSPEAGFVGESKPIPTPKPSLEPLPNDDKLVEKARGIGYEAYKIDEKNPRSGSRGWLSRDGKSWIGAGSDEHDTVAWNILRKEGETPHPTIQPSQEVTATQRFYNKWIRKTSDHDYDIGSKIDSASIRTVAEDGTPGRSLSIDYFDKDGSVKYIDVGRWEDIDDLMSQVRRSIINNRRYELGKVGGPALMTGMGIGGAVGYAAGHALGVPPEMTGSIGMIAGMLAPHVFERLRPELSKIAPLLKNTGISMRDWVRGPDQKPINDSMMENIIDRQRNSPEGMVGKLVARITQLPPELQKRVFDKFSTINDQAGPWQRLIGQLDPLNKVFNRLKISENDSAYIAARMAEGGSSGRIEIRRAIYKNVIDEAQKLGLTNYLTKYLNLTNYRRVYQVLREHADNLDMQEQNLRTKLQNPSLTTRQQVALENDLADTVKAKADLNERIKSGQVVPDYNEAQINTSLSFFKRDTDPQDFAKVHELATKVWQTNRDILDLAHEGKDHIISDAEYKTYTDRGIEYTPMKRIMEANVDHPANTGNHNANISPLYLRHQNIIKALEGSARTNVDPITASANAAFHSIREVRRNQVINKLIDEAEQDPNGVGNLFKQVPSGYKLGPNESLVGGYRGDGQQVTYAVPRALGETLRVASPAALQTTFAAMSRFAAQQFRKGVTIANVAFAVFSIPRHAMDQMAMSKSGANILNIPEVAGWVRDYVKAAGSTIVKGEWYREALKNDALDGTLQRAITPEKDMLPGKGPRRTTIGAIEEFNKRWDSIAKTLTYNRMIEAGHTPVEAAWEARRYGGAPDYSHMGTDMPVLNLAFMFLNAKIQYETRLLTAIADKERVAHMAGFIAASTIATLALWEHNHSQRDKDGSLLWNKVPYNDRERYYCILTGKQEDQHTGATTATYFRIPKSPVSQAFTNPMEDMLFKMSKSDDRSMKQIGLNNFQNWLPGEFDLQEGQLKRSIGYGLLNTINPIVKVPLGEYANVDPAFGGRPIVPKREEDIETSLQGGAATPDIYKRMGQGGIPGAIAGGTAGGTMGAMWGGRTGALIGGVGGAAIGAYGISPRRLEYGVQGLTGGVGQMTARLADTVTGSRSTFPYRGQEAIKQIPVAGQVAGRFMGSSADQTFLNESRKFYEEYGQQLSTIKNSMNFIKKNQPEQAADYATQHAPEIHLAKLYDASAQKVNKINVKIQQIQSMMEQKQIDEGPGFEALQTLFEAKKQIMKAFNGAADTVLKTPPASPSRQEGWSR
jgi:hypothetical protein